MTQTADRLLDMQTEHRVSKAAQRSYTPRNDLVLVKLKENVATAGGLLLPKQRKKSYPLDEAIVRAVGPGDVYTSGPMAGEHIPLDIKVGDHVVFPNQDPADARQPSPPMVMHNGEECMVLPESSIICTVTPD